MVILYLSNHLQHKLLATIPHLMQMASFRKPAHRNITTGDHHVGLARAFPSAFGCRRSGVGDPPAAVQVACASPGAFGCYAKWGGQQPE